MSQNRTKLQIRLPDGIDSCTELPSMYVIFRYVPSCLVKPPHFSLSSGLRVTRIETEHLTVPYKAVVFVSYSPVLAEIYPAGMGKTRRAET
jgi:hypothetical protein